MLDSTEKFYIEGLEIEPIQFDVFVKQNKIKFHKGEDTLRLKITYDFMLNNLRDVKDYKDLSSNLKFNRYTKEECDKYISQYTNKEDILFANINYIKAMVFRVYKLDILLEKCNEKFDEFIEKSYKLHKQYKKHYYIGLVLWMSVCLWAPFLLGFIAGFGTMAYDFQGIIANFVNGFVYLTAFSFTTPITLPLSFVIGIWLHPMFLKYILFSDKYPYCDEAMKALGHSETQEKANVTAILAGTVLSKVIK